MSGKVPAHPSLSPIVSRMYTWARDRRAGRPKRVNDSDACRTDKAGLHLQALRQFPDVCGADPGALFLPAFKEQCMTRVHRQRQDPQFHHRTEGGGPPRSVDSVTSRDAAASVTTPAAPVPQAPAPQAPAPIQVAKPRYMDWPPALPEEAEGVDRAQDTHQRA